MGIHVITTGGNNQGCPQYSLVKRLVDAARFADIKKHNIIMLHLLNMWNIKIFVYVTTSFAVN